jgi:hypothetical protein
MAPWLLEDEQGEAELHKPRLTMVEQRPFRRITARLEKLNALRAARTRQAPTPPPESTRPATEAANGTPAETEAAAAPAEAPPPPPPPTSTLAADLEQMKEDLALDFAAFDGNIARLQFLLTANTAERERYAADRLRVMATSQAVREDTARLRGALGRALATLEQRKQFDELAERITSNRLLRPRADQRANLAKLEEECAALEAESDNYAETWRERKDQFARIMDESERLRRLIRDEKEEVERREGMDDEDGAGAEGDGDGHTPRPGLASGNATPRPDHANGGGVPPAKSRGVTPAVGVDEVDAPRPTSRGSGRTPARESPGPDADEAERTDRLKPASGLRGTLSRSVSRTGSREGSPVVSAGPAPVPDEEGDADVEMQEATQAVASSVGQGNEADPGANTESGTQDGGAGEQMDTT